MFLKNSIFIALFFLLACGNGQHSKDEIPLAEVNGKYLFPSDFLGQNYAIEDTSLITKEAINNWVKRELLYNYAASKQSLNKDLEKKLFDYEQSLIINAYEENLMLNFPASISEEDILSFYKNNLTKYQVEENVYKLQYLITPVELDFIDKALPLLNANSNSPEIDKFCEENQKRCFLKASWVAEDVLNSLDLPNYLWTKSAKFEKYYLDENIVLLYRILDNRRAGDVIPLEIVKDEIHEILLIQAQKQFLKEKEEDIFNKAKNENSFEIF